MFFTHKLSILYWTVQESLHVSHTSEATNLHLLLCEKLQNDERTAKVSQVLNGFVRIVIVHGLGQVGRLSQDLSPVEGAKQNEYQSGGMETT
jgi:hypothetical protein